MFNYFDRVFYELDCFLNAIGGGPEDQTISLRAALASRREKKLHRVGPGCILCAWLNLTVERDHCAKQLDGKSVVRWAAVAAGAQLLALAFVIFYLPLIWALM